LVFAPSSPILTNYYLPLSEALYAMEVPVKLFALFLIFINFFVHAKSEPDFSIKYPDKLCVDNQFRDQVNWQVDSFLLDEKISDLEFYLAIRDFALVENAVKTKSKLDLKMLFLIHSILEQIESTEENIKLFSDLRNKLTLNPLFSGRELNSRVLPQIDNFIGAGI